jgi:O-antigen/teichoic acid export membrane protein
LIINKYLFNLNWLFLDKLIRGFGGIAITILIARNIGPENFGVLSFAITITAMFSFMSNLGLNSIVIREITKDKKNSERLVATTFYLKLIGAVVAFISGTAVIYFLKAEDSEIQFLVMLLLLGYVFQSMDAVDYFFQAKVLSKYVVISRNLAFFVSGGLKVLFVFLNLDVAYLAFAFVFDLALSSLFMFLIYKKVSHFNGSWKLDHVLAKSLLKDSWPLMLSTFFIMLYMKVDQIMIEHFLDMESVGLYSVAITLSEAWYFIPTIIVSTLTPYFVKLREEGRYLYLRNLKKVNTLMFWMGVIVGVVVTIFGQEIIALLFGHDYKDAYLALSLNIWAGIFVSIGVASNLWLIAENLQIYRLIGTSIGVCLNIIGNYYLIPIYGISGAAIATLITQGLGLWLFPFFFKPLRVFTLISITSIFPIYLVRKS